MKRATKIALSAGAALSIGLAAAAAVAHPYGAGGGPGWGMGQGMHGSGMGYGMHGYGMGPGSGMGPGYGMMGPGYGRGNAEDRLASLKSELGITAKQESAWQAFADNAKTQAENRQAWFDKMRELRATGSAPEVLAQRSELMKQHQAELQSTASALKNLYAVLTPEQKTIADRRFGGFDRGPGRGTGPAAQR